MRKAIAVAMLLLGCAGAQREARSTPVPARAAAPAELGSAPAPAPENGPASEVTTAPAPKNGPASEEAVARASRASTPKTEPASTATAAPAVRAGATPEAAAPAKSVSSQFASAVAAFDAGRLDEAKQLFEAVAGRDDQHAAARYNLGVIAERQGDLAAAERQYRDALAVDPVRARALLGLGKVLRAQGRAEEAVKLLQDALQRPGLAGDPALLNALAAAERSAGQLPQAEATARQVLVRVPDDAEAYRTLALCALDQNNPRLAELYALTARKRSEKDAATANTLGLVYLKLDERPRALAELQRALALDPSFAPAQLNLGALALSSRDYATAEKAFSRALELQPWSRQALLLRAWALDGLRAQDPRRGADAGAAFEKVLGLQPDDPEATCGAGFGYAADKAGYDRAVPFLERCQKLASTPQERQAAEAKLRTIQAVMSATQQKKEEAAPQGSGGSGEGSEPPADGPPAPPK